MARRAALLAVALLFGGCEPDGVQQTGERPRGFVLDAGIWGSRDAAAPDAATPPPADAGQVDAGPAPVACECPVLPRTCTPPPADTPLFTSDRTTPQAALVQLISCATETLDAALYAFDWPCLENALFARLALAPQLRVRIAIDDDQCPRDSDGKLTCALRDLEGDPRVTIVDDQRSRYMHHKFWIADDQRMWTGSANMLEGSFCRDLNDALVIESPAVIAGYRTRFHQLFEEGDFGPQARVAPAAEAPYEAHFGPQSPLSEAPSWYVRLMEAAEAATTSLDIMVFSFTREDLAQAIAAAHRRGVQVRVLVGSRYASTSAIEALQLAGIEVRKGPVHSKVAVIDHRIVATGSPNWSNNAWANNEDSLWIDSLRIADAYTAEIDALYDALEPL